MLEEGYFLGILQHCLLLLLLLLAELVYLVHEFVYFLVGFGVFQTE